jgi:hypothetical protein
VGGRDFEDRDDDTVPVAAIVNMAFARTFLHTDAPLGRSFIRDDGTRHVVVGISGNARYGTLRGGMAPIVYMPMKPPRVFTLYVRSTMASSALASLVARESRALGFGMRVRDVATLGGLVVNTIVTERLLADIGAASAFVGLALGLVGLFGLLNYIVTERTPEIGVRMALGAPRAGIYILVLREAVGPIVLGLFAGGVLSLSAIRWVRSLLFDVSVVDPRVVALAFGAFLAAAIAACAIPARRAAAIDPAVAVRQQ